MTAFAHIAWAAVCVVGWLCLYRERLFDGFVAWLTRDFHTPQRPDNGAVQHGSGDGADGAGATHGEVQ